ncbi:MgtC/SapB family protein [Haliangium ochraceum]|uniref:MgtC/SapB transporter n=1 Tax=Haliangium ochraceum (strain DSM 14365 / JCM 11303 / SMP-2) TaxID=502025 RepID=D0LTB4_HALO1|nr:MgtC/SapB family protein [Haliangium ochraceum]ACY13809.1 MgtC/SapB transporter [Haliangium ochraceum DSM 14365]
MLAQFLHTETPLSAICLRLVLAIVCGAAIGIDREVRRKAAGLRTHVLIALAAAIFTLLTFEIFFAMNALVEEPRIDVIRIVEAVTAGVAFLAAGTIIQSGGSVQGLTTGASMWLAGAVGLACGSGFYSIAVLGTLLSLTVLILLGLVEKRWLPDADD